MVIVRNFSRNQNYTFQNSLNSSRSSSLNWRSSLNKGYKIINIRIRECLAAEEKLLYRFSVDSFIYVRLIKIFPGDCIQLVQAMQLG